MPAYLRDPSAIYQESFARIAAELDGVAMPPDLAPVFMRIVHACGMPDVVADLDWSPTVGTSACQALAVGRSVLVDTAMVATGILRTQLGAGSEVRCFLDHPEASARAQRDGTTRSAAAVELWRPHLSGSVVVIGNAPTALFRLLEILADGDPPPAAILGFPVGFVGAAESKRALADGGHGVPFLTLHGRRGGSAMAAAALNALADLGSP